MRAVASVFLGIVLAGCSSIDPNHRPLVAPEGLVESDAEDGGALNRWILGRVGGLEERRRNPDFGRNSRGRDRDRYR